MWNVLKPTDIVQAKRDLELCRAATLQRQAEEIEKLEADQAEIDELRRLAASFFSKFKKAATASAPPPVALAAARDPVRSKPAFEPVRAEPRKGPRTNFDTFSRAVSRAGF
jgi:hypothetical protein